jgi:type IV pilus assembly protein PilQ
MRKKIVCLAFFVLMAICLLPLGHAQELTIDTSSPFLPEMSSKKISMDFQEAPLVDVLKIFSQQSGFNMVTTEDLRNRLVTVYLDNVPVEEALNQILKANSLTYEIQSESNIYLVKPLTKPDVELLTRVYRLKNSTVASAKINSTLSISSSSEEGGGGGGGGGGTSASGITDAVKAVLTSRGQVIEDPRTNSLIVTDIASNFNVVDSAIARLDVAVPQILIEVEMLEVSKQATDKIGIKMGTQPLVFQGATRNSVYPWDRNKLIDQGLFDEAYTPGSIDTSGLTAALQFLRTQSDTKSLARPRILTLNNQTAQIRISTQEAIGVKDQQSSTGGAGIATSSVEAERVETGVILTVTPQANVDNGEITLAVIPKFIVAREGGTFSSASGRSVTFKDPEERGSQSLLKIHSGDTIVIGGLLRTDNTNTTTKLPFFGDIPLIGGAFRHRDKTSTDRELIIFITPHIIKDSENSKTAAVRTDIVREQDMPVKRLREVDQKLSEVEKQNL